MIVWGCDRCRETTTMAGRKNQRPDGWVSIRTVPPYPEKGVSLLFCTECAEHFQRWLGLGKEGDQQ